MTPCCNLCKEKYIDEQGNVDIDRYHAAVDAYDERTGKMTSELVRMRPLCFCACHQDGKFVLH